MVKTSGKLAPYTSVPDLKRYLGTDFQAVDDGLLFTFLTAARSAIDTRTGRTFECDHDTDRYFYADEVSFDVGLNSHMLNFWHEDLAQVSNISFVCEHCAEHRYVLHPRRKPPFHRIQLQSWRSCCSQTRDSVAMVSGRWSFSVSPPDDIVQASTRLAAWFYRQKDTHADMGSGQVIPSANGTVIIPGGMPRDVLEMLAAYERTT